MEKPTHIEQPTQLHVLNEQDKKDREDLLFLLSIMDKQGAAGETQSMDYVDALRYRDSLEAFMKMKSPEGNIALHFDDIIFDFDGVLYDSTYAAYKATQIVVERYGKKHIPVPVSVEESANTYSAPQKNYYRRFGIMLETHEQVEEFKAKYRKVYAEIDRDHHTPAQLYPEVKEMLATFQALKKTHPKLRIHIISAGTEKHIKDVLVREGVAQDFDQIHFECHDKTAMIDQIASGGVKEKTIMIGDLPSDIKDAQAVGVSTIAVARGEREFERLGHYLPNYVVSNLSELFNLTSYNRELRMREFNKENPFVDRKVADEWSMSVEKEAGLWRDVFLYPSLNTWLGKVGGKKVILDIGAGQGRVSEELEGYGQYIGVEPSEALVARAKNMYQTRNRVFMRGNAYELPLPSDSVDGVLSVNVWFHLSDTVQAAQELSRVLKPGGTFSITTADQDSLKTWKSFYINPAIDGVKMEGEVKVPVINMSKNTFYFHTNDELIKSLTRCGLDVTGVKKSLEMDGETLFITFEGVKRADNALSNQGV